MLDLKNAGLTELLNNFYTLTGLKLCIFDTDFEECASTPIKLYPLCLRAREDPEFERRCHSCDAAHMQICRRTRKPLLYRCHAGLTEYLAPLYYEGVIVAFICIGMMTDGTQKEFDAIAAYTAQFGISEQTCRELYDKHRHYTPANIKAACSILDACISHIYHQRMLEVRSLDTAQQIENTSTTTSPGTCPSSTCARTFPSPARSCISCSTRTSMPPSLTTSAASASPWPSS